MKNSDKLDVIRHSTAHVLAAAVLEMFPEAKFGIGPAIENGFYYDFDLPRTLIPEDLPILEEKMRAIIKKNYPFEKQEIEVKKATALFKKAGQSYKVELTKDIRNDTRKGVTRQGKKNNILTDVTPTVTLYKTGPFVDLCAGPHIDSTGEINPGAFKLTKISGAYWKGSEKNKMLQRIYGAVFESKNELDGYLHRLEEAEKRDHRKIGRELELFHIDENVGKGLPLWMPKGAVLRQTLQRFIEDEETKRGYLRTYTPVIGNVKLYKMSGHWDHYRDDMYPPMKIENEEYILRPMTCPHQFMIYKAKPRSYKELPLRYAELAEMYRKEKSGELTGLIRIMGFTLNDAHIICTPGQLEKEFFGVLDLVKYSLKALGLDKSVTFRASLRDKDKAKYIANEKLWNESEKILKNILKKARIKHTIGIGDAAFYGPKADVQVKNVHGKEETLITVQIDLNSAERFDMSYIDEKGKKQRPVIIHRSAIGCIERTVAFLLEHYAGALPIWLSPIQAAIIPIGKNHIEYANSIDSQLKTANIRTEIKNENETMGKKIREAEMQKIPYMLIIGDKEIEACLVSVRSREKGNFGQMKINKFIAQINKEIKEKR